MRVFVFLALFCVSCANLTYGFDLNVNVRCDRGTNFNETHCALPDGPNGEVVDDYMMGLFSFCTLQSTNQAVDNEYSRAKFDEDAGTRNLRGEDRDLGRCNRCNCSRHCCLMGYCGTSCHCSCGCESRRNLSEQEEFMKVMEHRQLNPNIESFLSFICTVVVRSAARELILQGNHCMGTNYWEVDCDASVVE